MPWCPKCKNEYVEGILICADCKTALVDSLKEYEEAGRMQSEEYTEDFDKEHEDIAAEDGRLEGGVVFREKNTWHGPYQNSAQRAEENKSSAYTLLFVGVIGFAVSLLVLAGVIPLYQNAVTTRYLVCGVMGALFLLFIILGIVSMKTFKVLSVKAKSEDSLMAEMTKWCEDNLSGERIDEGLFEGEEVAEEQKYFKRADKMKQIIQDKFMNLEEGFLDHFVDDYYQKLF